MVSMIRPHVQLVFPYPFTHHPPPVLIGKSDRLAPVLCTGVQDVYLQLPTVPLPGLQVKMGTLRSRSGSVGTRHGKR
jgi:hypothetical protein